MTGDGLLGPLPVDPAQPRHDAHQQRASSGWVASGLRIVGDPVSSSVVAHRLLLPAGLVVQQTVVGVPVSPAASEIHGSRTVRDASGPVVALDVAPMRHQSVVSSAAVVSGGVAGRGAIRRSAPTSPRS